MAVTPQPPSGGEVSTLEWALTIATGVLTAIVGYLARQIHVVRDEDRDDRAEIWRQLNATTRDAADHRVKLAEHYPTKADLAALRAQVDTGLQQLRAELVERVDQRVGIAEQRILLAIERRGPVRQPSPDSEPAPRSSA